MKGTKTEGSYGFEVQFGKLSFRRIFYLPLVQIGASSCWLRVLCCQVFVAQRLDIPGAWQMPQV
jgi:hypothetical protein